MLRSVGCFWNERQKNTLLNLESWSNFVMRQRAECQVFGATCPQQQYRLNRFLLIFMGGRPQRPKEALRYQITHPYLNTVANYGLGLTIHKLKAYVHALYVYWIILDSGIWVGPCLYLTSNSLLNYCSFLISATSY